MGTRVCVVVFLLTALVTVVYCANDRRLQNRSCKGPCILKLLTATAGKRKKSVDLNQDSYLWNQMDTSPTYTADVMTEGQRSTCVIDEVLTKLSPQWQERLLSVLKGALMDNNGEPTDDKTDFGL